jgi:DNA-binding response OmpR family regulator
VELQVTELLLADDERAITDYLKPILEKAGFQVTVVRDGLSAMNHINQMLPDLVILDVLMPGLDGREVCRQMRASGNWTPVIMLTQVRTPSTKVLSLEEGADDYLCKPFDHKELIARVRALLRRRSIIPQSKPLSMASKFLSLDLVLDRCLRQVEKSGDLLVLTPKAFSLLEYLMLYHDQVHSREQLMDRVWGWMQPVATRAVDMRIAELRRALGDEADLPVYIETLIGVGYRYLPPVEGMDG